MIDYKTWEMREFDWNHWRFFCSLPAQNMFRLLFNLLHLTHQAKCKIFRFFLYWTPGWWMRRWLFCARWKKKYTFFLSKSQLGENKNHNRLCCKQKQDDNNTKTKWILYRSNSCSSLSAVIYSLCSVWGNNNISIHPTKHPPIPSPQQQLKY